MRSLVQSLARATAILAAAGCVSANIFGPIGTDRPAPAGGSISVDQPPNTFFQGFSPPYPTNNWWAGYAAGDGTAVSAGPFPYESNLTPTSIQFGISTSRQWDGVSIKQPTQTDWGAGFVEHNGNAQNHKALSWDTQTVTLQYFTGASTLTSYLVPGSPYLTFNYAGATPVFTSGQGLITSFGGTAVPNGGSVTKSGTQFLVVNTAGTYIIYSLNGNITLTATAANGSGTVKASAQFNGVIRVAKLNDPSHKALLDQYVANYPTAVTLDYSFSSSAPQATLKFIWTVTGNSANLLLLTWPHHRSKLQSPNFPATTALNYLTTKGWMYPVIGNTWNLLYNLPTIDWNAPRTPDSSCTAQIIQGLVYEVGKLSATTPSIPGDFYNWGNAIAAKARLALIADHVGRQDLIPPVIAYLKASYAYWFQASSAVVPAFETAWGGIINKAGYNNVWVDYGNGYYNVNHFHYGYFLTGAAVIAKYDSTWRSQYQTQINWYLRDIVNPTPADPFFPVTRHRDWFAGHSWASGIANGAGSRDQESSGEAINGYYGAMLWAEVIGDTDIKNYARLLIATEQHATQVYWHLYPSASPTDRDNPYPEASVRSLITMGNVEDWQSGAWLFWGAQKVEIAAIQILPVTPVNEYLYDSAWVNNIISYTANELSNSTYADAWKSVIYLAYSNANPQDAATRSAGLTDWGTGNTYTNQVYFLSTRPNTGGTICSAAQANPLGNYTIQVASSGKYVVASAASPNLVASATTKSAASVFNLAFAPNAGTLQLVASSQYVTADQSGTFALAAARGVASTWEIFVVRQKVGAAAGVYSIKAASNGLYVTVGADGSLLNNGATEASSIGFKFA
ncbi:glycoside hydrolase family 81 protein [Auriscalpium vulgare]|uniref:Glycoside hydrolase family 81 protein n=1 Tax=Auriscalpium vulgare TaxID=40419 RepID=A0ACB8RKZ6_9AGAM|nr:glycoside hydrolase family 81 protein [Auriscalpium vulgare]